MSEPTGVTNDWGIEQSEWERSLAMLHAKPFDETLFQGTIWRLVSSEEAGRLVLEDIAAFQFARRFHRQYARQRTRKMRRVKARQ